MGAAILIVDDEEALLSLLRRFLERQGFTVETYATSKAAWERFSQSPDDFAMVISDLNLDGVSGAELIDRMRAKRAGLPALITSGFPYVPPKGVGFLQKPFLPQALVDAVRLRLKS